MFKKGFETQRHRGHGEGRKEAEGGDRRDSEGIGRGKRYRRGCPKPDWILGVWVKALVVNSVDFVPLCFKKGF